MPDTVGQKKECVIQHQAQEGRSDRLVLREIVFCMCASSTTELLKAERATVTVGESAGQYSTIGVGGRGPP